MVLEQVKQHKEARQLASLNAYGSSSLTDERRKHYDTAWVSRDRSSHVKSI